MSFSTVVAAVAAQMAIRFPIWVVWFVAIGVALSRWRQHPRVSALVVGAVGVLALETIVNAFVTLGAPMLMRDAGSSAANIGTLLFAYHGAANVVAAAGWAMLLVAVFGWRAPAPPAPPA